MSEWKRPEPANQNHNVADRLTSAALVDWSRRPHQQANRAVATFALLAMTWLTAFAWQMPEGTSFLRHIGLIFVCTHALWHAVLLRALRRLCVRGVAGADEAMAAYLDPRRISNLDMAAVWLAFTLLVRILSTTLSAGGATLP